MTTAPLAVESPRTLRLLIVEDTSDDADFMVRTLHQAGYRLEWEVVEEEAAYLAALTRPVDLILSDYTLPQFSALRALELLSEHGLNIPLIVITGTVGEDIAVNCIKHGAADYLFKDRLARLGAAAGQVLEQRRLREAERQAEQSIAASQCRLEAIVNNALDAVFVTDDDGHYIDVNPAACQLTGYSSAELLALSVWDLTPAPDTESGLALWRQFVLAGRASGEYQIRRQDGTIVDIEFRAVANVLPNMHVSFCRDISTRKQAGEMRSLLAAIVDSSDDAIVSKTLDGCILSWNRGAQHLFGYTAAEMLGQSIAILYPPDHADELTMMLTRLRQGQHLEHHQTVRLTKDQRHLDVSASVFPIRDDTGTAIGAATILRDMTTEHQRQREGARSEKLRALGQLASGVAHDLNQSLALILGYSELLQAEIATEAPIVSSLSEMTSFIAQAAVDGGETVKRLLTFTRSEPDAPHERINLAAVLEEAARLTSPRWREMSQAEGRTIRLSVTTEPDLYVVGVAHQLRELLTNLVFNAVDALPDGGNITLSGTRDGGRVVAQVADNGVGMSQEAQARIFEPYFTTKGERGSGLGLSLVYGIVESHDGTISVVSAPGEGTTVSLSFPEVEPPALRTTADVLYDCPSRSLRVLAVDDEPAIATLMAHLLRSLGHQVTTAHSGEEGLLLLATGSFDVVISDVGMGNGMNGWQFVEQIRHSHPDLPVVLATGWGAAIGAEELARLGLSAVVSKPFRRTDLEMALTRLVARGVEEPRALALSETS